MDANRQVAERLDEMARLLEEQGANRFRVAAYHGGAEAVRGLARPLADLVAEGGLDALDAVPGIGPRLARIIHDLWVVIYHDGAGAEHQDTVVTATRGPLEGRRVVRGHEGECLELYAAGEAPGSADQG